MTEFKEYTLIANGISQHVTEAGSGPVVLLCHGFPELGYSWRHQIRSLADAGYRVLAPDMRGYGRTEVPEAIVDYTVLHLVGDMVGLLQALKVEAQCVVGHDWGAPVAWAAAQLRPDLFHSVVGMCVPFAARGPVSSLTAMRQAGLANFYQLYFQQPGIAEGDFERDVFGTIRRMMWTLSAGPSELWNGMIGSEGAYEALGEPDGPMSWLSADDLAIYADAFTRTGFGGSLNWYRNIDTNWAITAPFQGLKINQPALFITGDKDPIYPFLKKTIDSLPHSVPGHRGTIIVPDVGHWVQQEAPETVNAALADFLQHVIS